MPNHIRVREVHENKIEILIPNPVYNGFGDSLSTHLGTQVVSRDLRRRDQCSLFSSERSLSPTVEKVSDVSVLLGLGGLELPQPFTCEDLREPHPHVNGRKGNLNRQV